MNKKTKVEELKDTSNTKSVESPEKNRAKKTPRVTKTTKTAKTIRDTVDSSLNNSKETIKKNITGLKDVASDVSKTTAKRVKKVSDNAKQTIAKTSDNLAKVVKTNIANIKGFDKKIFIEYSGKQVSEEELIDKFKFQWTETHDLSEIKDLKVYYKVEEDTAYYTVNGNIYLSIKII
jgi:gas vesicle protein